MTSAFFDSHCHLQDACFAGRVQAVLARARTAGVTHLVCCGTREADWDRVLDLARDHAGVLPMLGLHPWFVAGAAPGWLDRLRARLRSARAGLGECGLDFASGRADRDAQEAAFGAQLRLAVELDLPLAIHCVGAWERLAGLLRAGGIPAAGAMVHGFSGSSEVAAQLQGLGLHLSFSAAVARPGARRGPRALAGADPARLLFETDAPGAGEGGREPAQVLEVARAAARIRRTPLEPLAGRVQQNALQLFGRLMA